MGALLFTVMHREQAGHVDSQAQPPAVGTPVVVAPVSHRTNKPAAPAAATPPSVGPAPIASEADQQRHRKAIAEAIAGLPLVDRAIWETQSTLLVTLLDDTTDPLPAICPLLFRYDELAPTRLELQPPPGSTKPVRFVQCRAF